MRNAKKNENLVSGERVENLMLVAVLGEEPYRKQAMQELEKRRLVSNSERLIDVFMTNLGVVC
jgi:hypothetical protein